MRGSAKGILLPKIHLPTTVTQCWIPPRKYATWINVGKSIFKAMDHIHILNQILCMRGCIVTPFLSNIINCHILGKFKHVLCFKRGYNIIYKNICSKFVINKEKSQKNEKNTQSLLIYCKTYNLGAPGTDFIITPTFVQPGGTSKGPFSHSSNNLA